MEPEKALAVKQIDATTLEALVYTGDLKSLTAQQRVDYYNHVCNSMGLNPATKPFGYINLNGKLTLYALRNCTDQLTRVNKISIVVTDKRTEEDLYIVEVEAKMPDGRVTSDIGAVNIKGLSGDGKANAIMKAFTKAKRRAVLSIVGLSLLDETEAETIPSARAAAFDDNLNAIKENLHKHYGAPFKDAKGGVLIEAEHKGLPQGQHPVDMLGKLTKEQQEVYGAIADKLVELCGTNGKMMETTLKLCTEIRNPETNEVTSKGIDTPMSLNYVKSTRKGAIMSQAQYALDNLNKLTKETLMSAIKVWEGQ